MSEWPKACACGAAYSAEQWATLALVGKVRSAKLELRNCTCGSTLAVPLVPRKPRSPSRLITASSARCFRACPRKYEWRHIKGLRPLKDSEPLRFGSLLHLALAAWWQRLEWAAAAEADPFDAAKARALMAGYSARWTLDGYEVVAIEAPFSAPLMDGAGAKVRGWRIAGKVDGIVRHEGRTLLLEHKSSSEDVSPGSDYWARLAIDSQISIYHDGARALGHEVAGCIYDVLKKPAVKVATVPLLDPGGLKVVLDAHGERVKTKTDSWRQTGDSGLGYVIQSRPETAEEYEARCMEYIAEHPVESYARSEVVRLDGELAAARDDLVATVRAIEQCAKRGHYARNDSACFEYGRCHYWPLCTGTGSEHDYRRVEDVHPELKEVQQ